MSGISFLCVLNFINHVLDSSKVVHKFSSNLSLNFCILQKKKKGCKDSWKNVLSKNDMNCGALLFSLKLYVALELLLEANHFYVRHPRAGCIRQYVHVGTFSK